MPANMFTSCEYVNCSSFWKKLFKWKKLLSSIQNKTIATLKARAPDVCLSRGGAMWVKLSLQIDECTDLGIFWLKQAAFSETDRN